MRIGVSYYFDELMGCFPFIGIAGGYETAELRDQSSKLFLEIPLGVAFIVANNLRLQIGAPFKLSLIVITVDDDTGYNADLLGQLIKHVVIYGSVVGSKGGNVDLWNIDGKLWSNKAPLAAGCYSGYDVSYCDVLEGYGAIAYPVKWVDVPTMSTLSQLSKACKTSDDIVISFGLGLSFAPLAKIAIPPSRLLVQYAYGFEQDALHRGSGFLNAPSTQSSSAERYQECATTLHQWHKAEQVSLPGAR